ncbi:MAG TPA: ABC transporter permease subunit [Candidatus Bathyarchaeia archaeon]|nr:ABC transporter permease subunit [Candidatus Bathyarchaeia archaeon]
MNPVALRLLRVPLALGVVWAVLAATIPLLMTMYGPYVMRPGFACAQSVFRNAGPEQPGGGCRSLADLYGVPFPELFMDAAFRSLALLLGAAVLALVLGTLIGTAAALVRGRALLSATILGLTTLAAAVPAFFVAYFLQIVVIMLGASTTTRAQFLPVYGFGYDGHLVLPLLSISIPAITYTAQLTATRMSEVLDADFITAARARGLRTRWILRVHVLPHVRPVILESLGIGLRVSVASLPIIEYLFLWRGIGQLALEAVGVHDAIALVACVLVIAALFTSLSAVADLSRPRALYRG